MHTIFTLLSYSIFPIITTIFYTKYLINKDDRKIAGFYGLYIGTLGILGILINNEWFNISLGISQIIYIVLDSYRIIVVGPYKKDLLIHHFINLVSFYLIFSTNYYELFSIFLILEYLPFLTMLSYNIPKKYIKITIWGRILFILLVRLPIFLYFFIYLKYNIMPIIYRIACRFSFLIFMCLDTYWINRLVKRL